MEIMKWSEKCNYQGERKNGKKNGYGVNFFTNGDKYEGEFRNDSYHGKGMYSWSDGKRYEG